MISKIITEVEPFIKIYKYQNKTRTEIPVKDLTKETIQEKNIEKIRFQYVSPVPGAEKNLLSKTNGLNIPRAFAELDIESLPNIERYLNPAERFNLEDYKQYLEPYKNQLDKIVNLSSYTKVWSDKSLEDNNKSGTYAESTKSYKNQGVKFTKPQLLETNKQRYRLKNTFTRFLHADAAALIWDYVEEKLRSIGIECIILDADNLSLAYKIYGSKKGYYPMLKKLELNDNCKIKIDGSKSERLLFPDPALNEPTPLERFQLETCDLTQGPAMFKIIDPTKPKPPKFDWTETIYRCSKKIGGGSRKRKIYRKKTQKRRTK